MKLLIKKFQFGSKTSHILRRKVKCCLNRYVNKPGSVFALSSYNQTQLTHALMFVVSVLIHHHIQAVRLSLHGRLGLA